MSKQVAAKLALQLGLPIHDIDASRLCHYCRDAGWHVQQVGGLWQVTSASGAVLASE